ncbi:MAG TPA: TIGR03435 family protein [Candidatus Binatia bacterium]
MLIDKTGLKGRFDFKLIYRPDPTTALEPPSLLPQAPVGYGSLSVEIEKQLGLKLVPVLGPRDYYIIEHVERPTPN